jgi:hypothetical protein
MINHLVYSRRMEKWNRRKQRFPKSRMLSSQGNSCCRYQFHFSEISVLFIRKMFVISVSNPCRGNYMWNFCDRTYGGCTTEGGVTPKCFCQAGYSPVQRQNFTLCNGKWILQIGESIVLLYKDRTLLCVMVSEYFR